jgi:anaerobic selenocysteine-containing dehydrogenase
MHNVNVLVKGKPRCTLLVHPTDAARHGIRDGELTRVTSSAGAIDVPAEVTEDIRPGVVSLPHGWGHNLPGTRLSVANANAGVNSNVLAPGTFVDVISGNAAVNGFPVTIAPSSGAAAGREARVVSEVPA